MTTMVEMKKAIREERKVAFKHPESALSFLRRLWGRVGISKNLFFESLVELESHPDLWNMYGTTFQDYLKAAKIPIRNRYQEWKLGRDAVGEEVADMIGFDATCLISRIDSEEDRRAAITEMMGKHRENGGIAISYSTAKKIVSGYVQDPPKGGKEKSEDEVTKLKKENATLREENEKLRLERDALAKELSELRSGLRKMFSAQSQREQVSDETSLTG